MVLFVSGNQSMYSTPAAILLFYLIGYMGQMGQMGQMDILDWTVIRHKSLINQECLPELPVKVFCMKEQKWMTE